MGIRQKKFFSIKVSLKNHTLDAVRYAAYAISDAFFVFISRVGKDALAVEFRPKGAGVFGTCGARFLGELADEKLRERIFEDNRELREFLVLKALSAPVKTEGLSDTGLTTEQERELDALISQVEKEISQEARSGKSRDPMGITKTWEEKYGAAKKTGI